MKIEMECNLCHHTEDVNFEHDEDPDGQDCQVCDRGHLRYNFVSYKDMIKFVNCPPSSTGEK